MMFWPDILLAIKRGWNMIWYLSQSNMFDHGLTMFHLVMKHGHYMVTDIIVWWYYQTCLAVISWSSSRQGSVLIAAEIFVTGWTGSCHNDNFQCSQWRKSDQNGIFVLVMWLSGWVFVNADDVFYQWLHWNRTIDKSQIANCDTNVVTLKLAKVMGLCVNVQIAHKCPNTWIIIL